jgi:hypothetical protein
VLYLVWINGEVYSDTAANVRITLQELVDEYEITENEDS